LSLSLQALIIPTNDLQTSPLVNESEILDRFFERKSDVHSSM